MLLFCEIIIICTDILIRLLARVMMQSHTHIRYNIRGMDGRGWGVGDGLPVVSRVSL